MRLPRPEALLGPAEWEDIAVTQWCLVPGILPHWECHRSSWQGAGSQCLQEIQMTWTTSSAPQIFTAEGKCSQEAPAEVTLHRRPAFVSRDKRDTSKQCLNQIHTQHRSWHLQVALQLGHLIRHWGNTMILGTTTKVFNQAYPAPALYQVLSYVLGKTCMRQTWCLLPWVPYSRESRQLSSIHGKEHFSSQIRPKEEKEQKNQAVWWFWKGIRDCLCFGGHERTF